MKQRSLDLAVNALPTHGDLSALPAEEAQAELARRHHVTGRAAFQAGKMGTVHLVRLPERRSVCGGAVPPDEHPLTLLGPLGCKSCLRVVAKRIHRSAGRRARRASPARRP